MTRQYHIPLPRRELMTAEDFMVTDSNRAAYRWIVEQPPAAWPSPGLILHGPKGCGKTHLLQIWQQAHAATPVTPANPAILERLVNAPQSLTALTLDNADLVATTETQETWLFHLYNAAREAKIPLLLTSTLPPQGWGLQLADLRSRLNSLLSVGLQEPNDELLTALLMKQFEDRQLRVDYEVIAYIVARMNRSGETARSLVEQIDQQALEQKRKISVLFVKELLNQNLSLDV